MVMKLLLLLQTRTKLATNVSRKDILPEIARMAGITPLELMDHLEAFREKKVLDVTTMLYSIHERRQRFLFLYSLAAPVVFI